MANAWTYAYTGAVQTWTAPSKGIYKIDLYGASGGSALGQAGCLGGHLTQYIQCNAGTTYYICVGGAGADNNIGLDANIVDGGYNGGGSGKSKTADYGQRTAGAGGGGATSIATTNGLLKNIATNAIVGVAGGGGGAWKQNDSSVSATSGNGTTAGNTIGNASTWGNNNYGQAGSGAGYYDGATPSLTSGGSLLSNRGACRAVVNAPTGYSNAIVYNVRSGNGYAQIEKVSADFTVSLGTTEITAISLGSTDISALSIGGN